MARSRNGGNLVAKPALAPRPAIAAPSVREIDAALERKYGASRYREL
jgi:hypothetical protein